MRAGCAFSTPRPVEFLILMRDAHFAARLTDYRRDILVEPEEIGRVVTGLDGCQPLPGCGRIGSTDTLFPFIIEEIHIGARKSLIQGGCEIRQPFLTHL